MNNLDLRIKLDKADIVNSAYVGLPKYYYRDDNERVTPERAFQLNIEGSVSNLISNTDLIIFDDGDEIGEDTYIDKIADNIIITIGVFDKDDTSLLLIPYIRLYDKTLYIGNLNYSFEQFEFIKNIVDDQFTILNLRLVKHVTKDEILKSKERNKGHIIGIDYDLDDLNYISEQRKIDEEESKVLLIKHSISDVRVGNFNILSSKSKYIKNGDWLPDVESIEDKEQEEQEQIEHNRIYVNENATQQNTVDQIGSNKQTTALLFWVKVLAILLVILIFKI